MNGNSAGNNNTRGTNAWWIKTAKTHGFEIGGDCRSPSNRIYVLQANYYIVTDPRFIGSFIKFHLKPKGDPTGKECTAIIKVTGENGVDINWFEPELVSVEMS